MKKILIGSIVGGLLIFIWQFLSWTMLNLHQPAAKYTPNEAAILQYLDSTLHDEGGYMVPGMPEGASKEECEKKMKEGDGKPWASIQYHKSHEANTSAMMMNMTRGLISNIIMVALLMWIFGKVNLPGFGTIFFACLAVGLISFINQPYTGHIWYHMFDIRAYLIDALVSWGLCGLWLGWYLSRRKVS